MKVLLYSSTSRTREGGVQAVYASVADGLRRRGRDVIEGWSSPASPPAPDEWIAPLHVPRTRNGLPGLSSLAASVRSALRLARDLSRLRPDVVHLHFVRFEALYFLLLRAFFGYRVVLTCHGSDVYRPDPASRRALRLLVRWADVVTAVSAPLQRRLQEMTPRRVRLVPNGIDVGFWSAETRRPPAVPTVVAVGRLEPVKGFDVLIEALRRLRETRDVRLVLVGEGRARPALEQQVAEAGVADAVTFSGHLGAAGVREAFQSASVLALPSRSEGLPLVVLEAMAAGLPVVASRVGGVPDLVTSQAGALVEPDDPAALAEALDGVLGGTPEHATDAGRAGRRQAQAYSVDAMVDAYERLYRAPGPEAVVSASRLEIAS